TTGRNASTAAARRIPRSRGWASAPRSMQAHCRRGATGWGSRWPARTAAWSASPASRWNCSGNDAQRAESAGRGGRMTTIPGRAWMGFAALAALLLAATMAWHLPMMLWDHIDLVPMYEAWQDGTLASSAFWQVHD